MCSVTVILLHACIASASAKELAENHNGNMQNSMDKLVDMLIDRAISTPVHHADVDNAALAKPSSGASLRTPAAINLYQAGSRPAQWAKFAPTQIAARRDASMKAHINQVFSSMDPVTRANMRKVIARAEGNPFNPEKPMVVPVLNETSASSPAPAPLTLRTSYLEAKDQAGALEPLGFWDPAGLSSAEQFTNGTFYNYRMAELKHGRVAMLAALGLLVSEKFHPLFDLANPIFGAALKDGKAELTAQMAAISQVDPSAMERVGGADDKVWTNAVDEHFLPVLVSKFWPVFFVVAGLIELALSQNDNNMPGDLNFDPLGLKPKDPKEWMAMQNKELNNGRLAMLATMGIIAQELVTGRPVI